MEAVETVKEEVVVTCAGCGAQANPALVLVTPGRCNGCGEALCYVCGCVGGRACVRAEIAPHTCSWLAPGVCTFCYFAAAKEAYVAATLGDFGALEKMSRRLEVIDWLVGLAQGAALADPAGGLFAAV